MTTVRYMAPVSAFGSRPTVRAISWSSSPQHCYPYGAEAFLLSWARAPAIAPEFSARSRRLIKRLAPRRVRARLHPTSTEFNVGQSGQEKIGNSVGAMIRTGRDG